MQHICSVFGLGYEALALSPAIITRDLEMSYEPDGAELYWNHNVKPGLGITNSISLEKGKAITGREHG